MDMNNEISKQPSEVDLEDIKTEMPPNLRSSLPDRRYLLGNKEEYLRICVPLYAASLKGNWEAAEKIIRQNPEVKRCSITGNLETALHIAASAKSTKSMKEFVRKLVDCMEPQDLKLKNKSGNTALCLAAAGGVVDIAKILVNCCEDLLNIPGSKGMLPLYIASLYGRYEMVKYLYEKSNMMNGVAWTDQNRGWVLLKCVEADIFDIAVRMVEDRPDLIKGGDVLAVLAKKTYAFTEKKHHFIRIVINQLFAVIHGVERERHALQLLSIIWNNIVKKTNNEVDFIIRGPADMEPQDNKATTSHDRPKKYSSRILFIAAEMGNTKFIVELIRLYPDLIWKVNDRNQSILVEYPSVGQVHTA